jgi:hypothetical protein
MIKEEGYAVVHPRPNHPCSLRHEPEKAFPTKTQSEDDIARRRDCDRLHARGRGPLTWADGRESDVTAFPGAFVQTVDEILKMGAEPFGMFVETTLDPH